jgi:hypothetical protein
MNVHNLILSIILGSIWILGSAQASGDVTVELDGVPATSAPPVQYAPMHRFHLDDQQYEVQIPWEGAIPSGGFVPRPEQMPPRGYRIVRLVRDGQPYPIELGAEGLSSGNNGGWTEAQRLMQQRFEDDFFTCTPRCKAGLIASGVVVGLGVVGYLTYLLAF